MNTVTAADVDVHISICDKYHTGIEVINRKSDLHFILHELKLNS